MKILPIYAEWILHVASTQKEKEKKYLQLTNQIGGQKEKNSWGTNLITYCSFHSKSRTPVQAACNFPSL